LLVALEDDLDADMVCLHATLTTAGPWPSRHLAGRRDLARMPEGALLVNTGRGGAAEVDNLVLPCTLPGAERVFA
jgi:erythronate-4-phosphate dehydrogenase